MKTRSTLAVLLLLAALTCRLQAQEAKITFNDHVLPVFKNACLNCHNPDKKKAGLDLSTYQATLAGSDSGKVLQSGNPGASLLMKTVRHDEEPKMPPKGDKLSDGDLALIEKWIAGQLLETSSSKAIAPTNNVQLTVISLDRPAGPPPMPTADLPLEPIVRTKANNALVAMAASPWAPLIAVGGQKQIVLYNTETLQSLGILPFPEGFPSVIRFSKNGQLLLTGGGLGGKSGKVVLWKVETGERIGQIGDEFDQVLGADLSPDHAFVALGGPTKVLKIYSTKDGKLVETVKKHADWITAVVFSPDGKYLASADRNGGIEIWEGATGKPYISLAGHKAMVTAMAFMPGVLASASEDGKITLWDVKEGKEVRSWNAHPGGVMSVDFTTDGRLVSCGRDRIAKAWDQTGKVLLTSAPFSDIALRAVLSNERVIAGDWSGNIRVFNLPDGKQLGELSANPPMIDEGLAAAEQQLKTLEDQSSAGRTTVTALEQRLVTELETLKKKRAGDVAALERTQKDAQAEVAAAQKALADLEQQLRIDRNALEALAKARDAKPEVERAQSQPEIDAQTAKVKEAEARLAKAKADAAKAAPLLQKKIAEAQAALAELQKQPVKLTPTAEALAKLEAARKVLPPLEAEAEKIRQERDKQKGGTPPYAQADARLNAKRAQIAQARAVLTGAQEQASGAPVEVELARARKSLAETEAQIPKARNDVQRWHRARDFMVVHRAKQSLNDLQGKFEELSAAAKAALAPAEKIQGEISAAEKVTATAAGVVKEKEAALAKLRAELEASRKAAANAKSALEAAEARAKAATEAAPAVPNEVPTAKETLAKAEQALKLLEGKVAEGSKVAEAARKIQETENGKLAELRKNAAEIVKIAKAAKAKAEADAASAAKELESAKAQADRTRAEYEARYRAQQQSVAPKPLAAQ